ncbi:uncharacterized protein LOC117406651 isoform X1 [Acipenser ruthenus]|uniref:uncharacterized protein LOC117406651 isoform X1 n=1 Tax=Acipenser ruthenus TaxID=7906 RepID=UPI00145AAFD9|nr:uncharacterized protein LOC117406651 isoform X1 [Acipenser ruthenus]XP_033866739.3 uncharacterized protein LOC117406651 isoform X1 [Acipenser ruthenus]XP_033866740.3 uncharacterized protein LOC117406651 isoform X1 [Acipenser ruthenus]XP_033866741.3 uncharacterized protein LOC117406651 isoform X1 [Acipenser ruthenus]XP_033866742.3 uncharacterized protein LOC117406651 isoform X1 [Acipenser ruthenus]
MVELRKAAGEALWGMFIADAMSMPVHWYYVVNNIKEDFNGWITGYQAPKSRHPSSIMSLSSSAGSGRTSLSQGSQAPVVGNIILHDKLKFWKRSGECVHYHQGMQPGDNTLNALCGLRAARTLIDGKFSNVSEGGARATVLAEYVRFMTTPGTHKDTYAESFHRSFFADWRESCPVSANMILEFAEERYRQKMNLSYADSQLDTIGCLPMGIPFILLSARSNEGEAVKAAVEVVRLTHPHPNVDKYVALYARALHSVLNGACLKQQCEAALRSSVLDAWDVCRPYMEKAARYPKSSEERLKVYQIATAYLGLACYTKGALSCMFFLAHQYADDFTGGVLANTNCGGENCHRGAALGALLGAAALHQGSALPLHWKHGLATTAKDLQRITQEML